MTIVVLDSKQEETNVLDLNENSHLCLLTSFSIENVEKGSQLTVLLETNRKLSECTNFLQIFYDYWLRSRRHARKKTNRFCLIFFRRTVLFL